MNQSKYEAYAKRGKTRASELRGSGFTCDWKEKWASFLSQSCRVKALANEDTLLPTQMFPRLPARKTFVADTNFVSGTQKMFLILFRNIFCPRHKCFPVCAAKETSWATMCP